MTEIVKQDSTAILSLIERAATDSEIDLDKLDRFLDLKDKWEANEARKAYTAALAAFKRNPPELVKDQQVDFTPKNGRRVRYKHASLGDVASKVAAGLAEHGLSHGWDVSQGKDFVSVACTLTHEMGHSEEVIIQGPIDTTGNKNPVQQIGSTITYLQRYTLMAITGLAAHEQDDDGQASAPRSDARPSVEQPEQAQGIDFPAQQQEPTRVDLAKAYLDKVNGEDTLTETNFTSIAGAIAAPVREVFDGPVKDWLAADSDRTWKLAAIMICEHVIGG